MIGRGFRQGRALDDSVPRKFAACFFGSAIGCLSFRFRMRSACRLGTERRRGLASNRLQRQVIGQARRFARERKFFAEKVLRERRQRRSAPAAVYQGWLEDGTSGLTCNTRTAGPAWT